MKKIIILLLLISFNNMFSQTDPFANLNFLIGNWAGEGKGFGNSISKIESSFRFDMNGKYIEVINRSSFEPSVNNTEGEIHKDAGYISYDNARNKIVYRQFNIEGYVNQYILVDSLSTDSKFVFATEIIENFVPGGSARFTILKINNDNIETIFDVALPGKEFACFGKNKLKRNNELTLGKDKNFEFVPQWAKSAIWYQIFPERFRNGDKNNDPTINDLVGADPVTPPKNWQVHPWGSDWYRLQEYERENGEPELWKHLLRRRYGGDLQGVIDKLDYLSDLGINAIYLNPVFDSPSLHKYDGASYHHIDPNFGPDPAGDRALIENEDASNPNSWVWTKADELALKLISEAHKRNIKIIFDGVFNHMGINSFAFKDVKKNQKKSPYKGWFNVLSWNDPKTGSKFDYEGWFGVKSLPEFKEDENGIVKGPREYIFHATKRWMNPKEKGIEFGIDGWRLDVAFCIAHPFWKDWRKHVRSINPEAYLTAEIVDKPETVIPYMQGDEFDGEMNYNFAFTCAEFFFNSDSLKISATKFDKELKYLRELYPKGVAYVSQNLFGSHDANRIGSHIVNRNLWKFRDWSNYYNKSKSPDNPKYEVRKPNQHELKLQKLFAIMQFTYVGAPMIYYGDEIGMWGANDPDCRKPMIWDDINYDDEVYNANGTKRQPDKVEINYDLKSHYQKLIAIRNKYKSLQYGSYKTLLADDQRDLFIFERVHNNQKIIVVLNNSEENSTINLKAEKDIMYYDELNDLNYKVQNGTLKINLDKKWGSILVEKI